MAESAIFSAPSSSSLPVLYRFSLTSLAVGDHTLNVVFCGVYAAPKSSPLYASLSSSADFALTLCSASAFTGQNTVEKVTIAVNTPVINFLNICSLH